VRGRIPKECVRNFNSPWELDGVRTACAILPRSIQADMELEISIPPGN
jgi:hypothetical protein